MKATGIVRRIDNLGRVVIPKEIRRSQRIRAGDPLEIFTDNDEGIIFRKYSPNDLGFIAGGMARSFYKRSGYPVLICNCDKVIDLMGGNMPLKEIVGRRISEDLYEHMELVRKEGLIFGKFAELEPVERLHEFKSFLSAPFINDTRDIFGSFSLLYSQDVPDMSLEHFHQFTMAVSCVGDQFDEK